MATLELQRFPEASTTADLNMLLQRVTALTNERLRLTESVTIARREAARYRELSERLSRPDASVQGESDE